jgi:hypothetical protein
MKRIELDQYQKAKFQAMVMKLFPEYKHFEWKESDTFWLYNRKGLKSDLIWFHWYEFTINELIHRLNYPKNVVNNTGVITVDEVLSFNINPINYLYNKFKEIIK